ncbi:hypothetical protein I551_2534 [Mycobacterium ulcerans str. Harvey]|uniref:Uncharacterized protein n=1 Tax=Mycobacterium ulcerans str. Harvey TaxID=1299332 RepID=A0ABN0R197_MYCUL|nr:hypothetical protein I551_2534 [Mycobacterium ulcerans str. Harvey]
MSSSSRPPMIASFGVALARSVSEILLSCRVISRERSAHLDHPT